MKFLLDVRRLLSVIFNQQTPPDLEQVWRDFTDRVKSLFGMKSSQKKPSSMGSSSKPSPDGKGFIFSFALFLTIALTIWFLSGFYVVGANQQAVELLFGRYVRTLDPGLHWHWPFPIESREIYGITNVRTVQLGYRDNPEDIDKDEATMLTDDENIINIQFSVQYSVRDVKKFAFNNSSTPDDWVRKASESAMREVVGRHVMDYVLYGGRADISERCRTLIQDILDRYETGIQVIKVNLQNAQPPEQVQDAFSDAVKAVQDRERQKNEGQTYANSIIPRAKGDASRILLTAEGYKQRVVDVAKGDSRRFEEVLEAYKRNPKITEDRLYLDAMSNVLKRSSKVYVSSHASQNLLYLPLDKIIPVGDKKSVSSSASDNYSPPATDHTDNFEAKSSNVSREPQSSHRDDVAIILKSRERGERL
ncbi:MULTISPECIES: FtsH protease activity modulator HflK [Candidatus Ichthyocystis]|uniref:Protein HflK n=1 Tax=Candidatus Ichthyocystis hellenicum TaxID=1561003 RepID=A0A0S4M4H0_9BURK|nr:MULTISPECIES: FtsH protease activity modulator HflK [Ichthyocystis]CUT17903.1 membrane protease subunit HflK [Candidatus Ichthyocystis hellenicum]